MSDEILFDIWKDRKEFSRYYHNWKAENDRDSQLIFAFRKGFAQGIALAQGIEQGKMEAVVNMIKELQITVSKAMKVAKLPEEKRAELIRELENKQISYIE